MKEYKFRIYKEEVVVIPSDDEVAAWIEVSKLNPELLGMDWRVDLVATPITLAQKNADVNNELTDHDPLFDEDDYSYLDPSLRNRC
jgi:hypothetical protein